MCARWGCWFGWYSSVSGKIAHRATRNVVCTLKEKVSALPCITSSTVGICVVVNDNYNIVQRVRSPKDAFHECSANSEPTQVPTDAGFSFNQQPVDAFPAAPSKRRPAFSPCNPAKAKDDIMRKGKLMRENNHSCSAHCYG